MMASGDASAARRRALKSSESCQGAQRWQGRLASDASAITPCRAVSEFSLWIRRTSWSTTARDSIAHRAAMDALATLDRMHAPKKDSCGWGGGWCGGRGGEERDRAPRGRRSV